MRSKLPFRFSFFVLLFSGLSLLLFASRPSSALAQESTPSDDEVNAIASQLFCPVCENTPLDVCPTEACRQWRDLIRQMLAEGKTEAEIRQYFVENYGARVLAEPPRTGFNWLVYVVPPAAFLLGAFLLFRGLRSWQAQTRLAAAEAAPESEARTAPPTGDEYVARLEEELKKRK
jgi:cytochrome c-type biogenesis protein CcmH